MEKTNQSVKQIGIIAAVCAILSLLFLPVISFLGTASGVELLGSLFRSKDSEDALIGILLIGIIGCGVVTIFNYASSRFKEGVGTSIGGLVGYALGILFLIGKFDTAEAIKLLGAGAWISIICFLGAALAPKLAGISATQPQKDNTIGKEEELHGDPRLLAKEETIRQRLHEKPLDIDLLMQHAQALKDLGRLREAAKEAEKVLGINEKHRDAAIFLAATYHELGDANRVTEMLFLLNGLEGISANEYGELATLHAEIEGDLQKAISAVEAGLRAYPDDPQLLAQLTSLRIAAGDSEAALGLSAEDLVKLSNSPEVLASLLNIAIEAKQFTEAYRIAQELHRHQADNQSASLFALAAELNDYSRQQIADNFRKYNERLNRINLSELQGIEQRHFQFLSGLIKLIGDQSIAEGMTQVKRVLTMDPEIYPIWKNVLDQTFSRLAGVSESPSVKQNLLDNIIILSKHLKSIELTNLAAELSRRLGEDYEIKREWANAERLYALSLELSENADVQKALDRVSLISRKKTLKIAGISVAVLVIVVVPLSVSWFFTHGKVVIVTESGATGSLKKGAGNDMGPEVFIDAGNGRYESGYLSSGIWQLSIKKSGFKEYKKLVTVKGGATLNIVAPLDTIIYTIFVNSLPTGATVLLDNTPIGKTPLTRVNVRGLYHVLDIMKDGYKPFHKNISYQGSDTISLTSVSLVSSTIEHAIIYFANQGWFNSGIMISRTCGSLHIAAAGTVCACDPASRCGDKRYHAGVGPEGHTNLPHTGNLPMNDKPNMCLVGRIGDGAPFYIGPDCTLIPNSSGLLMFTVNDDGCDDNSGFFEIRVAVSDEGSSN